MTFNSFIRDLGLGLSDHIGCYPPYFVADEADTMDPLWRGEESVLQGKHVIAMFSAPFNYPNVENLAQWNNNGKSFIAQKSVHVIAAGNMLTGISVAAMRSSSGVLMTTS